MVLLKIIVGKQYLDKLSMYTVFNGQTGVL